MAVYKNVENIRKLFDNEYKNTQKLINEGETHLDNLAEGFSEAIRVLDMLPAEDVVPKSEYETLELTLEAERSFKPLAITIAKQEVAKEIFEEIEKLLDYHSYTQFFQGEICPTSYFEKDLEDSIAELKKKYIGE